MASVRERPPVPRLRFLTPGEAVPSRRIISLEVKLPRTPLGFRAGIEDPSDPDIDLPGLQQQLFASQTHLPEPFRAAYFHSLDNPAGRDLFDRREDCTYLWDYGQVVSQGATTLNKFYHWFGERYGPKYLRTFRSQVLRPAGRGLTKFGEAALLLSAVFALDDFTVRERYFVDEHPFNFKYERPVIGFDPLFNTMSLSLHLLVEPMAEDKTRLLAVAAGLHKTVLDIQQAIPRHEPLGLRLLQNLFEGVYGSRMLTGGQRSEAIAGLLGSPATAMVPAVPGTAPLARTKPPRDLLVDDGPVDPYLMTCLDHPLLLGRREDTALPGLATVHAVYSYVRSQGVNDNAAEFMRRFIERAAEVLPRLVPGATMTPNLRAATIIGIFRALETITQVPGLPFLGVVFDTVKQHWQVADGLDHPREVVADAEPPRFDRRKRLTGGGRSGG